MNTNPLISIVISILACAVMVVALPVFGQDGAADGPEVTRADLAVSYLRFEQAMEHAELDDSQMATTNRSFDQATLAFFQRKFGEAIQAINEGALFVDPRTRDSEAWRAAVAWRVLVVPPVYRPGGSDPVAQVEALYDSGLTLPKAHVALRSLDGETVLRVPLVAPTTGGGVTIALEGGKKLKPGRYEVGIEVEDRFFRTSALSVVPESLETVRARNAAVLDGITGKGETFDQALASVKARNALLTDSPSVEKSAEFLFDPIVLMAEIDEDIAALKRGEDPFMNRRGDYWRVVKTGDREIPIRVYLPDSAAKKERMPVVVAFHGAGGDENMFLDAYGAGIIKDLADEHGFLVISPLTYEFRGADMVDSMRGVLEVVGMNYAMDPGRIYVTGHSMGGGATTTLAASMVDTFAAACCLAGFGGYKGKTDVPPTLVIAAELDPLANPARLHPLATLAIEAGLPVEYKEYPHFGHTIVVGESLPYAIEWMLKHRKDL